MKNNKKRARLKPTEAIALGFKARPGSDQGNAEYRLTQEQWDDVCEMRKDDGNYQREIPKIKQSSKPTQAKVLIFDIESSPSLGYFWGKWQQNIHDDQLVNEWFLLTWSAKWLFEDKIYSAKLTGKEAKLQEDKRVVAALWHMLDEADIVIGHNIDKFDLPMMNARFLKHGFSSPSSYQTIDTLKHVRKRFKLHSNKLNYVAQYLGLGSKVSHEGFEMWKKCYNGDEEALTAMQEYNDGDVKLTEEVYLEIRSYIKPHPNLGLFINDDKHRCPCCGSDQLIPTGNYYTTMNIYEEYTCGSCGSNSRSKKANKKGKGIMSSLPR